VDDELVSKQVQVERKVFSFTLRQNRGRFLRITEDVHGRRDSIIIPSTGLGEVRTVIDQMIKADEAPDRRRERSLPRTAPGNALSMAAPARRLAWFVSPHGYGHASARRPSWRRFRRVARPSA